MSRSSPCHPFLHSVMQSAISSDMNHMQPGLKSRDRDLGVICIHIWRDHPNPGPKSGRRITGGGSYVTVCLVTLTTIPLARISLFPLVPSNNGIICSNSASASCLLVRQFPRGTSTSPHMSQHARIGDPRLPEALPCPIICFWTTHPLLFSDFHIQVVESFLKTLMQRKWDVLLSYIR